MCATKPITSLAIVVCLGMAAGASEQSLKSQSDYSDNYKSTQLLWKTARFSDVSRSPQSQEGAGRRAQATGAVKIDIQFGLAHPRQYDPQADTRYPLVVYLHGAGARGSSLNSVLQRQTPREFVLHGQNSTSYAAFVLASQVPTDGYWAQTRWEDGPYEQTEATYTDFMYLTDRLIAYMTDPNNNAALATVLGMDANDIETTRLYVVGDSMGAYGTWDMIGRHPGLFAAAIAASGSGPRNKLAEILETPFWTIHGIVDALVPNALPSVQDRDGAGTLGMLAMMDPNFNNTASTALIRLDNYQTSADDPTPADRLIYTQFPSSYAHATVALQWTTLVPGVKEWLFAHQLPKGLVESPALINIAPATSFEATGNGGMVLSINGIDAHDMILGKTTFPDPPKYAEYPASGADDLDLSTASAGDGQPYVNILYDQPVTTILICEDGGDDTGYARALDASGQPIGGQVAWGKDSFLMIGVTFLSWEGAVMVIAATDPNTPVYGVQFLPVDEGSVSIDVVSAPAVSAR